MVKVMGYRFWFVFLLVLAISISGCIGEKATQTPTTTQVQGRTLYKLLENESQYAVTWILRLENESSLVSISTGKAVILKDKVLSYREAKGFKDVRWSSSSIILWENGTGKMIMKMTVGNVTRPYKDIKKFNYTVAKRIAIPYGEIALTLSDEFKFNETKVSEECNDKCTMYIKKSNGEDVFGVYPNTWRIEVVEANVTYDPVTKKIIDASIYMRTSEKFEEKVEMAFHWDKGTIESIRRELEEIYKEYTTQ
ncbi:hypothetical protein P8X24_03380 [Pyrococcus kukulkanii]|uniref:hypothetical protein n=1 Tax=Pyrococcus kukulkanii TaxID=1609559 RepID=UPI003562AC11